MMIGLPKEELERFLLVNILEAYFTKKEAIMQIVLSSHKPDIKNDLLTFPNIAFILEQSQAFVNILNLAFSKEKDLSISKAEVGFYKCEQEYIVYIEINCEQSSLLENDESDILTYVRAMFDAIDGEIIQPYIKNGVVTADWKDKVNISLKELAALEKDVRSSLPILKAHNVFSAKLGNTGEELKPDFLDNLPPPETGHFEELIINNCVLQTIQVKTSSLTFKLHEKTKLYTQKLQVSAEPNLFAELYEDKKVEDLYDITVRVQRNAFEQLLSTQLLTYELSKQTSFDFDDAEFPDNKV